VALADNWIEIFVVVEKNKLLLMRGKDLESTREKNVGQENKKPFIEAGVLPSRGRPP
jgi:hypothetical protein